MAVNQVKAGAFLSYATIFINNIVGLLYTPFMLRMMGQNEYGLYSLVSSVVAYLTILDFGFNNAIVRYTARYRAEGKIEEQYKLFGMFLILYLTVGVLVLIIGTPLYYSVDSLFGDTMSLEDLEKIRIMMIILVGNVAITFPMSIFGGILSAYEKFVFIKVVNIVRVILNPLVMIIMLLNGYRAIGMAIITTIFNILTLLSNVYYCFYVLKIKIKIAKIDWGFFREVSMYSVWIFLAVIVDRLYWGTGQFVLGVYKSSVEIAIFAIAIQIQSLYTSFSYAISGVLYPKIVAQVTLGSSSKVISDFFIKVARIQFYPISLILFAFILFGRKFIIFWAGRDYLDAYWMSLMFMIPQLFTTMQQSGYSVLQAKNKVKYRSLSLLVTSIFVIVISIPISKIFGGLGVSICIGVGIIIGHLIILNIYYHKEIGLNMIEFWKNSISLMIFPVFLTVIYYFIFQFDIGDGVGCYIIHIIIFIILYLIGCILFCFNEHEKSELRLFYHKTLNIINSTF